MVIFLNGGRVRFRFRVRVVVGVRGRVWALRFVFETGEKER
jgi:hypothetical protein